MINLVKQSQVDERKRANITSDHKLPVNCKLFSSCENVCRNGREEPERIKESQRWNRARKRIIRKEVEDKDRRQYCSDDICFSHGMMYPRIVIPDLWNKLERRNKQCKETKSKMSHQPADFRNSPVLEFLIPPAKVGSDKRDEEINACHVQQNP